MSIEVLILKINPAVKELALELETAMINGGIISPNEKAMFLATCAHESVNFSKLSENLNYSAERLQVVFKKYFPTPELAQKYARKPVAIGSRVYANRMGNGDEASQEGWIHRGRGVIQLTGKNNYAAYSKAYYGDNRILLQPDLVSQPFDAARSAVWFWNTNECARYARAGDFVAVCGIVNVGNSRATPRQIIGFDDRLAEYTKILQLQKAMIQ